jgi:uncharacterized protein
VLVYPVHVAECRLGLGVFALRPFQPGEEILAITGPRVDISSLDGPAWQAFMDRGEPVQVGPYRVHRARSARPVRQPQLRAERRPIPRLAITALRPVVAGEEVLFDYSTTMQEDYWTMQCQCGTAFCRRVIEDFRCLPAPLQQEYCAAGVVQAFIARQYGPAPVNG